jgi:outer membrane protein assembly factor BamB
MSSISVADGLVYTMGQLTKNEDSVQCLDASTGEERWTFTYDCAQNPKLYEGGPNATPTVVDGRVYTFSREGHVFCLEAKSGKKVWGTKLSQKVPSWGFSGSVLIVGDKAILNAGAAGVALDKADGKVLWESAAAGAGYATPLPFKDGQVLIFTSTRLVAVSVADGKELWSHEWKTRYGVNAADPILVDGGKKVFIASGYGKGCALLDVSGAQPRELWANNNMFNKHTCSVLYKGAIYGFSETALACIDAQTGETKWTKKGLGRGSVALADGKLIVLGEKGALAIAEASPEGYKELASSTILKSKCWTVPVLANGRIFARDTTKSTGTLVCVSVGK